MEMTPAVISEQEHITRWAFLASWAWSELRQCDEIPEFVRGELMATWSAQYLAGSEDS